MSGMQSRLRSTLRFLAHGRAERTTSGRAFNIPVKQEVTNEVVELDGVLLVRLGGCSAMQVKLEANSDNVLMRVVPIAEATRLDNDAAWQAATDSQLRSWFGNGAIWQWLLAKGVDLESIGRRLDRAAAPAEQAPRKPAALALRAAP